MKKSWFYVLLMAEAVFCLLFYLLQAHFSAVFSAIIAFPFEQIGIGLRKLSLSGTAGNVFAIVIYILVSLIPVFIFRLLKKRKKICAIDYFLMALCVLMFVVIYFMINPGLFGTTVPGGGKLVLGGTFYSVFFGYIILRILYKCCRMKLRGLQRGLLILLHIVIILFVYMVFGSCFDGFLQGIRTLQETNYVTGWDANLLPADSSLILTYVFLALQNIVNAVPYVLDILVTFAGIKLLRELMEDQYSDEAVHLAEKLSGLCVRSLAAAVVISMAFNVVQLIFHSQLYRINCAVSIPLFSVAFVLAALILAKFIQENQKLKQDNDLFI